MVYVSGFLLLKSAVKFQTDTTLSVGSWVKEKPDLLDPVYSQLVTCTGLEPMNPP